MRHPVKGGRYIGNRLIITKDKGFDTIGFQLFGFVCTAGGAGNFPTVGLQLPGNKAGGKPQSETEQLIGHQGTFCNAIILCRAQ